MGVMRGEWMGDGVWLQFQGVNPNIMPHIRPLHVSEPQLKGHNDVAKGSVFYPPFTGYKDLPVSGKFRYIGCRMDMPHIPLPHITPVVFWHDSLVWHDCGDDHNSDHHTWSDFYQKTFK